MQNLFPEFTCLPPEYDNWNIASPLAGNTTFRLAVELQFKT